MKQTTTPTPGAAGAETSVLSNILGERRENKSDFNVKAVENQGDSCGFVTTIKTPTASNKRVTRDEDGGLVKKPACVISGGWARVHRTSNEKELPPLIEKVGDREDVVVVLGYIPGTEPAAGESKGAPYRISSTRKLRKLLKLSDDEVLPTGLLEIEGVKYATRTKDNFVFSEWALFDYDPDGDMPKHLQTDDVETWISLMDEMIPGFSGAAKVVTPSTTSRILSYDEPAYPSRGFHCFVQVEDTDDLERFAQELKALARIHKNGYTAKTKNGAVIAKTITDLTTFSPERVVFDGKPVVSGGGLSVANSDIKVFPGGRLDTSLTLITKQQAKAIEKQTGDRIVFSKSGTGRRLASTVNYMLLTLETVFTVDTGGGTSKDMTFEEIWLLGKRQRCQTAFRASNSFNGFIAFPEGDAPPFHYDNGIHTRYMLSENEVQKHWKSRALAWVDDPSITPEEIESKWISYAKKLDIVTRDKLRRKVSKRTKIGLIILKEELKNAEKTWAEDREKKALEIEKKQREDEGRTIIEWKADDVGKIHREVLRVLNKDTAHGYIFSHGGELVHIVTDLPNSVRMVQRRHSEGSSYPEMKVIRPYKSGSILSRISDSCSFVDHSDSFIGPPDKIVRVIMDEPPSWAHPLSGLLESPNVRPDGTILDKQGYDVNTGLFTVFPPSLASEFIENPTKDDALRALAYLKDELLEGFEFVSKLDKSMVLVCLFVMLQRRFMDIAPGFLSTASVQQSGKTTLLELIFMVLFGRPLACESWLEDEIETDKRLLSILREGHPAALLDNVPDGCVMENNAISRYLTSPMYQSRLLGKSEMIKSPTDAVLVITGNNVKPGTDLVSRIWPTRLESSTENPMDRAFSRAHMGEWAEKNRPKVLGAAVCILQAYRLGGERVEVSGSRYKMVDELVRAPLEWLGEPDIMPLVDSNLQEDERTQIERKMLRTLHNEFGDELFTTSEVFPHWSVSDFGIEEGSVADGLRGLFPKYTPTPIGIGRRFGKMENRIVGGLKLIKIRYENTKASSKWKVVSVAPLTPLARAPDSNLQMERGNGEYSLSSMSVNEVSSTYLESSKLKTEHMHRGAIGESAIIPSDPYLEQNRCSHCALDFYCPGASSAPDKCPTGYDYLIKPARDKELENV
jgi:hypothetical protein